MYIQIKVLHCTKAGRIHCTDFLENLLKGEHLEHYTGFGGTHPQCAVVRLAAASPGMTTLGAVHDLFSSILEYILKVPHRTLCGMKVDCLLSHCEIWWSHNSDYKDEFLLGCDTACLNKNLLTSQKNVVDCVWNVMAHTHTETRFRLSAKPTSPFKSAWVSVQSTTGSWGVRISGSNAGYTFWGSVKSTGYPLQFASFPFTSPPLHHRVPSHFNWTVPSSSVLKCW